MRYPAYTEWQPIAARPLNRLPAHWRWRRLRFLTERIEQGWSPQCDNLPADDDAWGVMKVGCVNGHGFDATENKALPPALPPLPEYELQPGDVLVSRANTRELVGSAALVPRGVRPRLLLCDKLFRLRPMPGIEPAFLVYLLRTPAARFHYERDATGASGSMQNIGQDTLKDLVVPLPPEEEQRRIANFLDWKTGQIDALIAKKQGLIERLKEARQTLIFRAVTGGLDASVGQVPSGVPWIGAIPQHWAITRLKYVAQLESGHTPSRSVEDYWIDCTIPWVSLNDSKTLRERDSIRDTHYCINALGLANSSARMLPADTVVFSRDATVGLCAITEVPMAVSQHFVAYICGPLLLPKYLLLILKAMEQHLKSLQTGSTIATIGMPEVRDLRAPLPPVEEQRAIVLYVEDECKRLDQLIQRVQSAIGRLTEYRSALITATTTGQIEVRGVAVPAAT